MLYDGPHGARAQFHSHAMSVTIWILLVGLLLATAASVLLRFYLPKSEARRVDTGRWPVYARQVLTADEQALYYRLRRGLPDHVILAHVSLSYLLGVARSVPDDRRVSGRYRELTANFVICRANFQPVAVVELDRGSYDRPRPGLMDGRKIKALKSASLRVILVSAGEIPNDEDLARWLEIEEIPAQKIAIEKT